MNYVEDGVTLNGPLLYNLRFAPWYWPGKQRASIWFEN